MVEGQELTRLLAGLRPELTPEPYVYALGPAPAGTLAFATVAEDEGVTLVLTRDEADAAALPARWTAARITLRVPSELSAVGLTAAVSARLAAAGISCNVVAGLSHDHLFVPWDRRDEALAELQQLAREASSE
ncbi:ACT domain-containing protein [Geodermatophilus sp. SYSU D01176]